MFSLNYLLSDSLPTVSNTPTSPESFSISSSISAWDAYSSLLLVPLLVELSPARPVVQEQKSMTSYYFVHFSSLWFRVDIVGTIRSILMSLDSYFVVSKLICIWSHCDGMLSVFKQSSLLKKTNM